MSLPSSPVAERKVAQGRNPVQLRLYKVLGTNFDDEATRQALSTLSELYASPKGKQVADDSEPVEEETVHYSEAAARARKFLRKDMERKLAEGSRQFLAAFAEVDEVRVLLYDVSIARRPRRNLEYFKAM